MSERPPRTPARAARAPASPLQPRIRDLCVASEGRMSRSVCARCAQDSPTVYCWRLGDSRIELDATDRQGGPRDYDVLRAAVSALLAGRQDEAAAAQADAARIDGGQRTTDAACRALSDRLHLARARAAVQLRSDERG